MLSPAGPASHAELFVIAGQARALLAAHVSMRGLDKQQAAPNPRMDLLRDKLASRITQIVDERDAARDYGDNLLNAPNPNRSAAFGGCGASGGVPKAAVAPKTLSPTPRTSPILPRTSPQESADAYEFPADWAGEVMGSPVIWPGHGTPLRRKAGWRVRKIGPRALRARDRAERRR